MATDSPKACMLHSPGNMVLRSGRTPGRTPMRHTMMVTPGSGNSDISMGMGLSWTMSPGHVAGGATDLLCSLNQEAAGIMDNLESLSAGPDNLGNILAMDMSSPVFSPTTRRELMELSGNLLFSPKPAAAAAAADDTGLAAAGFLGNSPRVRPFRASPYVLRSAEGSPMNGFACHSASVVYDAGHANKTSKRKLHMAEMQSAMPMVMTPAAAAEVMGGHGVAAATMPSAAAALASGQTSASSSAKKKEKRDKRTAAAPKRGEYKCGKCGFFPKKEKHNCDLERQKRIANGTFQDKSGKNDKRHMGAAAYMHGMHGSALSHGYAMTMGDPMLGYQSMQQHGQHPYAFHHMGKMSHMQTPPPHMSQHQHMQAGAQLQGVHMSHGGSSDGPRA